MRVVPARSRVDVFAHLPEVQRNQQASEALILERPDESLDYGDAAVLTHGAESRLDLAASAPTLERLAPELRSLVADEVLGLGLVVADRLGKKGADLVTVRLLREDGDAHDIP